MTDSVFDRLPENARIWVFGTERALPDRERSQLLASVEGFLGQWRAHGAPLSAARAWLHDRFLLVGVDESVTPPSGCSIDALVHTLKALEAEIGVTLVDNAPIYYRSANGVERVSRARFRELAEEGEVTADTPVFDNSITRMAQFRGGAWEVPARQSWHGKAFFRSAVSG